VGARYEGIDTQASYYDRPTVATRIENLRDLSFPDASFDVVVGNQTMEHWAEYGCPLDYGLWQCFRVCKPGGLVLLNVPIHFHGTRDFLLGDLPRIRERFTKFSTDVRLESWRSPSAPLEPYLPHADYPKLRSTAAYVLAIEAVANRPLPPKPFLRRVPMQLLRTLNYPLSFNALRVTRKIRTTFLSAE